MPERNANLLMSDAAQPPNGVTKANIIEWFGGPCNIIASGVFDGATVEVLAIIKYPSSGLRADVADADMISLATTAEPDVMSFGNLNPCGLIVKISSSGTNTRVRVQVS